MKLTPEQLLQPRYEVIADYPNSPFKVGDILSALNITGSLFANQQQTSFIDFYDEKYPHLFRKLEWWEKRSVEDMPEYLKSTPSKAVYKFKCFSNSDEAVVYVEDNYAPKALSYLLPATETDYQNYLNQTK